MISGGSRGGRILLDGGESGGGGIGLHLDVVCDNFGRIFVAAAAGDTSTTHGQIKTHAQTIQLKQGQNAGEGGRTRGLEMDDHGTSSGL